MRQILLEIITTFQDVGRIATFRSVASRKEPVRPATVVLLITVAMVAVAGLEAAAAGSDLKLNVDGFVSGIASWTVLGVLLVCVGAGSINVPLSRVVANLAVVGTLFVAANILEATLGETIGRELFGLSEFEIGMAKLVIVLGLFLWYFAAVWWMGRKIWRGQLRLPGLRLLAVFILSMFLVPYEPMVHGSATAWIRYDVWYLASQVVDDSSETPRSKQRKRVDVERAYHRQHALVRDALAAIKASPAERTQMYFVGAAPFATQDVFKREVLGAQAIFDEHFNTSNRSIILINHRDSVKTIAMASVSNLRAVINGVAERMDIDKDVLVLFITSHGSEDRLTFHFPRFALNDLTPTELSSMLAQSRIKNRIIILSACYSGSFISELADENTLIMTAAAADKTSFGCANDADWTFFGDALFNHGLRSTQSITDAFHMARKLVKQREEKEGLASSEPQISVGSNIARLLSDLAHGS